MSINLCFGNNIKISHLAYICVWFLRFKRMGIHYIRQTGTHICMPRIHANCSAYIQLNYQPIWTEGYCPKDSASAKSIQFRNAGTLLLIAHGIISSFGFGSYSVIRSTNLRLILYTCLNSPLESVDVANYLIRMISPKDQLTHPAMEIFRETLRIERLFAYYNGRRMSK
jgi:hypothetical protein